MQRCCGGLLPLSGRGVGVSEKIESGKSKIESERQNTVIRNKGECRVVVQGCCPSLEERGWGE